jgi:2-octaprenyl-6-methoxyphenol hydroxylase
MNIRRVDVAIVGGGLIGLSLAVALAEAGLTIAVIDRERPEISAADAFDGRASAIAWGSTRVLDAIGLWSAIAPNAARIDEIRVSDGDSQLFLHYDHHELGDTPLGFIVENRFIRRTLQDRVARTSRITWLAPLAVEALAVTPGRAELVCSDGQIIHAPLVVGCDGRRSFIRNAAGIGAHELAYDQVGIVATVRHDEPHGHIAHERFLAPGPLAMLPLPDGEDGAHRSSIVWTETTARAHAIAELDDASFSRELRERFGPTLGPLAVSGRRWTYPLELLLAERYGVPRVVLAGDAAHAIHPIAGQGLNLGLRDIAALAEAIVDAARLGLDIGQTALEPYERWRRFDNLALVAVTDSLNRLFSNDIAPVRLARDLGLAAVQQIPPLKRYFMRHAMGTTGELPRLARGEAL